MRDVEGTAKPRRVWAFIAIVGAVLAACSQTVNELTVFADPGKYEFYTCDQITAQRKFWVAREQELQLLMDKAKQSTGGAVVSVMAYHNDYLTAREEIKVIDATTRVKKCKIPEETQNNSAPK